MYIYLQRHRVPGYRHVMPQVVCNKRRGQAEVAQCTNDAYIATIDDCVEACANINGIIFKVLQTQTREDHTETEPTKEPINIEIVEI